MKISKKLRNKNHKTIANVETFSDGKAVFRDENHKIIGHYDPLTNRTLDQNHHTVGYGYLLPVLLDRSVLEQDDNEETNPVSEQGPQPSTPTSSEERVKLHARRNDLQNKINDERAKSADKIASIEAKRL